MKQNKKKKLVKDLAEIMIRNGVNPIDPKRIAGPLDLMEEDVAIILKDLSDELGLYYYYNILCPNCGNIMFTNEHRPDAKAESFLLCDKCNEVSAGDDYWVYGVYRIVDEAEIYKVVDQILEHLEATERPRKIYPTEIAKILNYPLESVVKSLGSISYLNFEYELICPHCGDILDAFYPNQVSQVSEYLQFPCKTCREDLTPIYEEDLHMVYRADGLTERGKGCVAITPEMVFLRHKLEKRRSSLSVEEEET